jgi:hypothetical protein
MPTFTGQAFANFYKRILQVSQTTNTGVDSTTRFIEDGTGVKTAIGIADDQLLVKPINDNSISTFDVQNNAGNGILKVDTTNSLVKVGASQVSATTQYAHFGCSSSEVVSLNFLADTHYAIPFTNTQYGATSANYAMGTSTTGSFNDTNPATTLTISGTAHEIVRTYWYVMDNITIDAVKWLHAADAAAGEATAGHLMAYTVDIANGSTSGDLTSGTVVADGANITNAGYEQIYYQSMTVQSADVDAGKVILFTFASDTVNSDYSINATVKYHIR